MVHLYHCVAIVGGVIVVDGGEETAAVVVARKDGVGVGEARALGGVVRV
jgi:hypothetical protein